MQLGLFLVVGVDKACKKVVGKLECGFGFVADGEGNDVYGFVDGGCVFEHDVILILKVCIGRLGVGQSLIVAYLV